MFPFSGEGGGEMTPTQLGPYLHLRTETGPVSETSCFLIQDDGKSPEKFCITAIAEQHTKKLRRCTKIQYWVYTVIQYGGDENFGTDCT
jgi:hypothetical protein